MGLALLREFLDDTISSQLDVAAYLKVPFLGLVPRLPEGVSGQEADLFTHFNPRSSIAEAVRGHRGLGLFEKRRGRIDRRTINRRIHARRIRQIQRHAIYAQCFEKREVLFYIGIPHDFVLYQHDGPLIIRLLHRRQ